MFESYLKPPISFPTLTGSIVTFNSQYAGLPLKSHSVAVVASQSGTGTPSPSNPCSISGWSQINISHSDADTSNPTVYVINLGSTVYGGEYDARTGVLTVTHILQSITSMQKAASGTFFYDISNGIASSDMLCNMADFGAIVTSHSQAPTYPKQVCLQQQSATNLRVLYYNADYTYEDWNTFISNNPFVVCVECQPTTIQLPPCPIDTLQGVNNIWADTGDTTLKYAKFG